MSANVSVSPLHLSITEGEHNVQMIESCDLGVLVAKMPDYGAIPRNNVRGYVLIALGVDEDHDEVFYSTDSVSGWADALAEAREAVMLCERGAAAGLTR